jgi:hypothetical protein
VNRIQGAIERLTGSTVHGWARADDSSEVTLEAILNGVSLKVKVSRIYRPDLEGSFGFLLDCGERIHPAEVLAGRFHIYAKSVSCSVTELAILTAAFSQSMAELVTSAMQNFSRADIARVLEAIGQLSAISELSGKPTPESISLRHQMTQRLRSMQETSRNTMTHVEFPLGLVSSDGTATLGMNGEAYLVGGTNSVIDLYLEGPSSPRFADLSLRWRDVVCSRQNRCNLLGAKFLQMIIPEKLSVHPSAFPYRISTPSVILSAVELAIDNDDSLSSCFISGLQALLTNISGARFFGRFDTHLTALGAYSLFRVTLRRMGLVSPFHVEFDEETQIVGDLAERLFGFAIPEVQNMPSAKVSESMSSGIVLSETSEPPEGHIGIKRVWNNSKAPIDLCIVAFANSFFERGGSARCLSWWFARAFREFHFIWSADIDFAYVARIKPDVVICQTIERFLLRTPSDYPE